MLAIERSRWAVGIHILQFAVPPNIAAFLHVDLVAGPAKNDYALDRHALAQRVIDIFFQRHNAAAAIRAVGCDNGDCAAGSIIAVTGLLALTAEDNYKCTTPIRAQANMAIAALGIFGR
jgi:hypothetical protein